MINGLISRPYSIKVLFPLMILAGSILAPKINAAAALQAIQVVTPSWIAQTHREGRALFFDLPRVMDEPEEKKLEFHIVPFN